MTRHLLDRSLSSGKDSQTHEGSRNRAFLRIARADRQNPVWREMHRAPRLEKPQPLQEALRIARGHRA